MRPGGWPSCMSELPTKCECAALPGHATKGAQLPSLVVILIPGAAHQVKWSGEGGGCPHTCAHTTGKELTCNGPQPRLSGRQSSALCLQHGSAGSPCIHQVSGRALHTPSVRSRTAYTKCQVPHCIHQVSGRALHTPSVRSRTGAAIKSRRALGHLSLTACACLPASQTLGKDNGTIRLNMHLLIDCSYCAATGMIAYGAVIGKATPTQLMWMMVALVRGARAALPQGPSGAVCAVPRGLQPQDLPRCSSPRSAAPGFASVQFRGGCSPRISLGAVPQGLQP